MDALAYERKRESVILENATACCFPPKEPIKPGHVMIVPKRYVERLDDCTPEEAKDMFLLIEEMMERVKRAYGEGTIVLLNSPGFKTQPRLHWHIVPSKVGTRHLFHASEGVPIRLEATPEELKAQVERLRQ